MKKIIDQSERRIQAHMDQRAHMQHLTDVPEVQAHGTVRGHVAAYQSKGRSVGPTLQSADHHGRSSGLGLHRLTPFAGSFLRSVQGATRRPTRCMTPIELPYKYERGG